MHCFLFNMWHTCVYLISQIMASDASSECEALFQAKNILATTEMREVRDFLSNNTYYKILAYRNMKL